jgi:integrase
MTRYPNNDLANKGKPWTIKALDAITSEWKGDAVSDGGGLVGEVRENTDGAIKIAFKYGFKLNGKKVWHYCGVYPDKALTDIRKSRDDAKLVISKGVDPRVKKVADKIVNREEQQAIIERDQKRKSDSLTLKDMFDVWVADGVKRSDGNKFINQEFNKYVIPVIGKTEVRKLTEHHLIKIYKDIVAAGKSATALELSKDVKQMLTWCEKRKPWRALLIDGNPALLVEMDKILPDDFTKVRDRVLNFDEIRKLNSVFDDSTESYQNADKKYETERPLKKEVQLAMWICLSTVCRIGELLMTEWKHVDLKKRNWFIPAANTKGTRKNKTDHNIYLSDFAFNQFKQLHELTGDTQWAFPARYTDGHVCVKSASKQIGDRQVKFKNRNKAHQYRVENNSLVLGDREWTPHDLRRTGATMIQSLVGKQTGILLADLCLHHNVVTGSAKHYLFDDYADEMREAWIKLGNRIEAILSADNVVNFEKVSA